jgi:hypothetical protein
LETFATARACPARKSAQISNNFTDRSSIPRILSFLLLLLAAPLVAQQVDQNPARRIEAVGKIQPEGDPQPHEKDAALASALRRIVLITLEQSSTNVASLRLVKARLEKLDLASLGEFFASREIIYEKSRRGYYEVNVGASPNLDKIKSWVVQFQTEPPIKKLRVMIVIPEQHLRNPIPDPAGETEMIRRFVQEGFRVVDQAQVKTIRDKDLVKRAIKDDPKELLAIAQSWGAELLLVGEAFSQDVRPVTRAAACRARIEARILQCDTAEILTAGDGEAGAEDSAPAVAAKAAIRNAATTLFEKLVTDLLIRNTGAQARSRVRVIVAGVDFGQKLQFKALLENLKDLVAEIEEISFMESRAEFDIATSATSGKLAEAVFLAAKKEGINLNVSEQSNRRCVFEIKPTH